MDFDARINALKVAAQTHGPTVVEGGLDGVTVDRPDLDKILEAAERYAAFLDPPESPAPVDIRSTLLDLGLAIDANPDAWGMLSTSLAEATIRQVVVETPDSPELDEAFLDAVLVIAAKLRTIAAWAHAEATPF